MARKVYAKRETMGGLAQPPQCRISSTSVFFIIAKDIITIIKTAKIDFFIEKTPKSNCFVLIIKQNVLSLQFEARNICFKLLCMMV